MASIKRCKGTGKAKSFGCGVELSYTENNGIKSYKAKYGLGLNCCYSNWLLSSEEGKKIIKNATLKATKTRRNFESFEKQEKDRKSLSWLLKNTVIACHNYIRKRDEGKPCISCQQPYNSKHQAGHFYKAELFSTLKFDETNIFGQCMGCNIHKEGNESEYRVHIQKRLTKYEFERLNKLAKEDKLSNHKWDREKLKEIRAYYLEKIKSLK